LSILSVDTPVADESLAASIPFTNQWLFKKVSHNNLKIEDIGNNRTLQHLVGAEYPLEVLQEWARQVHEGKKK
jgi:hypothetical protein